MHHLIIERPGDFERLRPYSEEGSFCVALTEAAYASIPPDWAPERVLTVANPAEGSRSLSGGTALLAQMVSENNHIRDPIIRLLMEASGRRRLIAAATNLNGTKCFVGAAPCIMSLNKFEDTRLGALIMQDLPGFKAVALSSDAVPPDGVAIRPLPGEGQFPEIACVRALVSAASIEIQEPCDAGGSVPETIPFPGGRLWFGAWPQIQRFEAWPRSSRSRPAPTIDVVIPAHNAAETIIRTVDAVVTQLADEDHVIIIENGSNDSTWTILCETYGNVPRVILQRQATPDAAQARTAGIGLSRAEYVAFCDADDVWSCSKLAVVREIVAHTGAQMILHPLLSIANGLPVILGAKFIIDRLPRFDDLLPDLLYGNFISTSGLAVHRSLLSRQPFALGLKQTQDYEAWCYLAMHHPRPIFAYVDEPLAFYRFWGGLSHALETRIVNVSGIVRRYAWQLPPRIRTRVRLRNFVRVLWYGIKDGVNLRLLWRALLVRPHPSIRGNREP